MFGRMHRMAILLAAAAALSACGARDSGSGGKTAAQAAAALITAAQARDRVAMEAVIDRPAVREDLRRQMVAVGEANGVGVDGGPSDFALDRMIGPDALARAAARLALGAPTPEQLTPRLSTLDAKHACLRDAGACILTFGKARRGGWRLVGMQATGLATPAVGD